MFFQGKSSYVEKREAINASLMGQTHLWINEALDFNKIQISNDQRKELCEKLWAGHIGSDKNLSPNILSLLSNYSYVFQKNTKHASVMMHSPMHQSLPSFYLELDDNKNIRFRKLTETKFLPPIAVSGFSLWKNYRKSEE